MAIKIIAKIHLINIKSHKKQFCGFTYTVMDTGLFVCAQDELLFPSTCSAVMGTAKETGKNYWGGAEKSWNIVLPLWEGVLLLRLARSGPHVQQAQHNWERQVQAGQPGREGRGGENRALSGLQWHGELNSNVLPCLIVAKNQRALAGSELCREKRQCSFLSYNLQWSFPSNVVSGELLDGFITEWRNAEKANPWEAGREHIPWAARGGQEGAWLLWEPSPHPSARFAAHP